MPETAPRPYPGDLCGASTGAIRLGDEAPFHIGPCVLRKDHDGPVHQAQDGTQWAGDVGRVSEAASRPDVPDAGGSELRDRIDEALRTVGLARNLAAYRNAVLPVVEAALAEQAAEFDEDIITPERALHEQTIERAERAEAALRDLTDPRPCDPHPGNGYCQTHGEKAPCPHAAAKAILDRTEETP